LLGSVSIMKWRGRTALMSASMGGHLDVISELLNAQADVDVQDEVRACANKGVIFITRTKTLQM